MKNLTSFLFVTLILITGQSFAQVKIYVDKTFGNGGTTEVNIGGFDNDVLGFEINHDSKAVSICGKATTAIPGIYKLAMVRLDTSGKLDQRFGNGGTVALNWAPSDYPNSMERHSNSDSMYILAGASHSLGLVDDHIPALFRIKNNGTPDSNFGINGRFTMQFDNESTGEAVNVHILDTGYVICGPLKGVISEAKSGFGVMRVNWYSGLDASFGFGGRAVIPALVHSVRGFTLNNRFTFMFGISDTGKQEIVIGVFNEHGVPIDSIGVHALVHTGIIVSGGNSFMANLQGDDKVLILLPTPDSSPTTLVICRFDPHGTNKDTYLDTTYGDKGFGRNLIPPSIIPKGMNAVSDYSTVVAGEAKVGLGQCIFTRINPLNAKPDPKYYPNGITTIDVDNGQYENYMKFVEPIGKLGNDRTFKRDIGMGASIHNGIKYFMITRFITETPAEVGEDPRSPEGLLSIYPNPAVNDLKVFIAKGEVKSIRVLDALGREVLDLKGQGFSAAPQTLTANISEIPDGVYYCLAQIGAEQVIKKIIIAH